MGITYRVSAAEMMRRLGLSVDIAQVTLWEEALGLQFPVVLHEFLSYVAGQPLFSTADIWTDRAPFTFYSEIEERIDEDREYWAENPEESEDDEYCQFSQIPQEEWPQQVSDYLEIGSDYGAGIVTYGISMGDLLHEDPPVYMHHEADILTQWEKTHDTLSDFLMMIVCDVLTCASYDTAQKVLEQLGWNYQTHKDPGEIQKALAAAEIDLSHASGHNSICGPDAEEFCCADDGRNALYIVRKHADGSMLSIISK